MQNGFIERFNRNYREAVLDMYGIQNRRLQKPFGLIGCTLRAARVSTWLDV